MVKVFKLKKAIFLEALCKANNLSYQGVNIEVSAVSSINSLNSNCLFFTSVFSELTTNNVIICSSIEARTLLTNNGVVIADNPRLCFVKLLSYLVSNIGIQYPDELPKISNTAVIGAGVVIENDCFVGDDVVIEPNVSIHRGTRIGPGSRIRSGASIGSDGFGFERDETGRPIRFEHLGGVVIGKNVEIGANTTVARGTLGNTLIEDDVKIDNLVHIAHNAKICQGALITACAEISGGVTVGKNAWIAPNSSTHQKLDIGEGALVGLGAVVLKNVPAKTVVAGNPAKPIRMLD